MMSKIRDWYRKLDNATKAGINTAWQSSAGTLLLTLLGFLRDVQEWADQSVRGEFPSVSPLGKAAASAVAGVVIGLLTFVYRRIKPVSTTYTDNGS